MERDAFLFLNEWKNEKNRKPLIIQGARQVGKTWLMKEFGKKAFKKTAYVNFDQNASLKEIFAKTRNVSDLIEAIGIDAGTTVTPDDTLIVLDEIQECPDALTALKYFNEDAPEYHVIVAGSLLGVAHHNGTGFPVGKVEFMTLYPLTFLEFLSAMGKEQLRSLLEKKNFALISPFSEELKMTLKRYFYIGGMPEIVQSFIDEGNYQKVRKLQKNILLAYENDFSKHTSSAMAERIKSLWLSIPVQLAKENKKFIYGVARKGARAREYEEGLNWLRDGGLIYKITRIKKPALPIRAYEDEAVFKIYMLDVGLLGAFADLNIKTLLENDTLFTEFKGALTEQYVLQQLQASDYGKTLHYWANEANTAEVDFIAQINNDIIPIEVKATINLKAKSLAGYRRDYSPAYAVRTSLADYKVDDGLYNIPLYMIGLLDNLISDK